MRSLCHILIAFVVAALPFRATAQISATDSAELRRLEDVWNDAHVRSDTTALKALWDDRLTVTVPEMPTMTKQELLVFWRSGRSNILRYETSDILVRTYENAGVVTGRLIRERNFNGRLLRDDWRFLKVYVRRNNRWLVVAYQATPSSGA